MWLKLALGPVLLWQGRQVRQRALQLPEAAGPRQGVEGRGPTLLRLLVVGDSAAAGVGVAHQHQALAAPLAAALARRRGGAVAWQLLATTGHQAGDALAALQTAALQPADLMLVALGVNDAVAQTSPRHWLATLDALHAQAVASAGVRYSLHTALPPMGDFPLLSQPLRWVLGRDARRLDQALRAHLAHRPDRGHAPLPSVPPGIAAADWMARDGFHPGQLGYQAWVQALAAQVDQWLAAGVGGGSGADAAVAASSPVPHCGQ
jgi:lysophospholipase L1-like esterase